VRAAAALGMTGVHHTDDSETLAVLAELFDVDLAA
jgi:hypothetical protein